MGLLNGTGRSRDPNNLVTERRKAWAAEHRDAGLFNLLHAIERRAVWARAGFAQDNGANAPGVILNGFMIHLGIFLACIAEQDRLTGWQP